jgi:ribosomal silencing factor RsfS
MDEGPYKRVNVMIREDQYHRLSESGLNLSGLIRDLLGDYLSENVVNIQVSEETRRIYDLVVSNTGSSDEEIEVHLRAALAKVLEQKIDEMQRIHQQLVDEAAQRNE